MISLIFWFAVLFSSEVYAAQHIADPSQTSFSETIALQPSDGSSGQTCLHDVNWRKLKPHPRLFANASKIELLKKQKDDVSKQLFALLKQKAQQELDKDDILYPSQGFKMGAMRDVQGRILTMSLYYRLTGEQKYFEEARKDLLQLSALSDWCPGHFLDVGEASLAAGVGLDWLHDKLSEEDRKIVVSAIVNNALLPSLDVPETPGSWVKGDFNWNQVCHSGLAVGALAIAEYEPELCRKIVHRAVESVPYGGAAYAPDGSYPEGPSYWSYGTTFHVILIEALRSVFNTSCGLESLSGFLKSATYKVQMVAPSGLDYNYSDYHLENQNNPIMVWFARELRQKDLSDIELGKISILHHELTAIGTRQTLNSSRHLGFELLWWDGTLKQDNHEQSLHWTAAGTLPLAVMRSSWSDTATFVAMKGGTPNYSHAHMDVGSFILEANGVRWALDLGSESYDKMRAAKLDLWSYSQNSNRWSTFRVGPDGHNILRFNNDRQNIEGKAEITVLKNSKLVGNAIDLTPVYRHQMADVKRTITLHPNGSVLIEDEWWALSDSVNASWQWLTMADVKSTGNQIVLSQNERTLLLEVQSTIPYSISVEDVSLPKNIQDSPNPDVKRIVIRVPTAPQQKVKLKVKAKSVN